MCVYVFSAIPPSLAYQWLLWSSGKGSHTLPALARASLSRAWRAYDAVLPSRGVPALMPPAWASSWPRLLGGGRSREKVLAIEQKSLSVIAEMDWLKESLQVAMKKNIRSHMYFVISRTVQVFCRRFLVTTASCCAPHTPLQRPSTPSRAPPRATPPTPASLALSASPPRSCPSEEGDRTGRPCQSECR